MAPYSKLKSQIAEILKEEGFINDFSVETNTTGIQSLKVFLKYVEGESVIHEIDRVSTPGRRIYQGVLEFAPVIGNLGIAILTTNRGVMTNKKAKELSVGGEVICTVW
jgi:small subunit ribosomal protein S8